MPQAFPSTQLEADKRQAIALLLNLAYHLNRGESSKFNDDLGLLCNQADARECEARLAWEEETNDAPWHDSATNAQLRHLLNRVRLTGDLGASFLQDRAAVAVAAE